MKKHLNYSIMIFLFAAIASCKKSTQPVPDQLNASMININGNNYPTVTLGEQLWTAVNYPGEGGIDLQTQDQKPEYGRYYTQVQAKAIPLPAGWRLPTAADFKKLCTTQGITLPDNAYYENSELLKKLMSTKEWAV